MNSLSLTGLFIYPIKSLGGISLKQARVEAMGLQYDRRWMLVDEQGVFITQRKYTELALLQVSIGQAGIMVYRKGNPEHHISFPFTAQTGKMIEVSIWDDQCLGAEVSVAVNAWFSAYMNKKVRLVRMPEQEKRQVDPKYAQQGEMVSFADGYPFLIISEASLAALNTKLVTPVPMNRFRPNLVFSGGEAHIEDQFDTFTIGGIAFKAVKPCARCVLTTVDQQTAQKGIEPLKTLAEYRLINNKIMFGQNLVHCGSGIIYLGDELLTNRWKPEHPHTLSS